MGKMQDMVAIVTGSSRGLGKAIALEYAREGALVVVCAWAESPAGLVGTIASTSRDIEAEGGKALAIGCDDTDEAQVRNMVAEVTRKLGRIDVPVNNAGVMNPRGPLWELDPVEWDQMMNINF